jgi:hypothetical protein
MMPFRQVLAARDFAELAAHRQSHNRIAATVTVPCKT